jgi:hypothetical protein
MRGLPDHDAAGRGHALEPGRRVRHVAGHVAADLRSRAERDDRLSGLDPDPRGELEAGVLRVQLPDRLLDPEGGPDGALGVVLVRRGGTEDGEDAVPEELGHPAPVPLDLALRPSVERSEGLLHLLGIRAIRSCGEAHQVAEEHRDEATLFGLPGYGRCERRAAVEAEARTGGVLLAARRTHAHGRRA